MSQKLTTQFKKTVNLTVNPTNTNTATIDIQIDAGNSATIDLSAIASATSGASSSNTNGAIVVRDSQGNFSGSTITGTDFVDSGLTANRAVISDGTKKLSSSSTTDTELGYVHGVTSPIQTQINAIAGSTITSLTGDVTASGSGAVPATVVSVGGSSAANIHTAELAANAATDANTPSTIVSRDASGDFSAGIITATLNGLADKASAIYPPITINGVPFDGSTNITVSADAQTLTGTFLNSTVVDSSLTSVGTITSGTWNGTPIDIVYGGTGQTTAANAINALVPTQSGHSGEFLTTDGSVVSWGTPTSGITQLTGDVTAGPGSGSQAATLATVNSNVGGFGSSTAIPSFTVNAKGLITAASSSAVIAPAGTLTGTTLASNVVTSSLTAVGTITSGTWNGTTIAIANGGTGQTTQTAAFDALSPMTASGDLIYGGASGTGTRLPKGSDGEVLTLVSGVPAWQPSAAAGSAGFMGSIQWAQTGGAYWSVQSGSFTAFTANGSIPSPTVTNKATDAGNNLPEVKFSSMAAGNYRLVAYGAIYQTGGNQNLHAVRFTDGTTNATPTVVYLTNAAALSWSGIEANFRYATTQTNVTFSLQGLSPSTDNLYIDLQQTNPAFQIDVYYFPDVP